jgi:uncharacterized membrane-anchored protein
MASPQGAGAAMCASVPTAPLYPAMMVQSFRFAAQRGNAKTQNRQQQETIMPLSAWIILGLIASLFSRLFASIFPSGLLNAAVPEVGVSELLGLVVLGMAYYAVSRYAGKRRPSADEARRMSTFRHFFKSSEKQS